MLIRNCVKQVKVNQLKNLKKIWVSEGIYNSWDVLGEEWESFKKDRLVKFVQKES